MTTRNLIPDLWGRRGSAFPLSNLREAMDRLLEDWSEGFEVELPQALREGNFPMTPRLDVEETEKEIQVIAELPGMDEKDIHINISKDRLSLRGEKKQEKEEKGKTFYRKERVFGSFHREITLPCQVEGDKASAIFKKGVLNITIPKSPEARKESREVPIRAE